MAGCAFEARSIMRALILSDIHSNIDAFEAVLAAAPSYDAVWNLGDLVGYNAAPNAVLERARRLGNTFVRGNHDRACCGLDDAENFNSIARPAVRWNERQLDEDAIEWLRELPKGPIQPTGASVYCVHGSLLDEDQYLLSASDAEDQPVHPDRRITFFGHTHIQGGFAANAEGEWARLRPAYSENDAAESYVLDLRESAMYLINPGSVGQPRDHDWRAAFAIYDTEANRVTHYRVPYDVRLAQMRIQRAGLPEMLGSRLRVGR